ncbi:hypothetical protein JXB02_06090 [Candidatus Woesearchaeota archaeon]|nr:hypothetical protein [Candidatus Woesearchaeota archaeon]
MAYVLWTKDLADDSLLSVGHKAWSLGRLARAGFKVPDGFVITADACTSFLEAGGLLKKIRNLLVVTDGKDKEKAQAISFQIQRLITASPFPKNLALDIAEGYQSLAVSTQEATSAQALLAAGDDAIVAVRPSPVVALPRIRRTFQSYLGIGTLDDLYAGVRSVWAQLHSAPAIMERNLLGYGHEEGMGILVQVMMPFDKTGHVRTEDVRDRQPGHAVISTVYGVGRHLPEAYERVIVDKRTEKVLLRRKGAQRHRFVRGRDGRMVRQDIPQPVLAAPTLLDRDLRLLLDAMQRIEETWHQPCYLRFGISHGKLYILSVRRMVMP